jgi:hypothetical protein
MDVIVNVARQHLNPLCPRTEPNVQLSLGTALLAPRHHGKRSTCSVWCCRLPSRTGFFSHFCSATEQTCGGMLIDVCVFPFIFVIDAALLFLYGIMFFVYAHSLGCHRTHFPAPHSFFYICFSLPIHIWFLSVDCCIMVPPIVLSYNFHHCWSLRVVVGPYTEPTFSSVLPSSRSFCPAGQIIKLNHYFTQPPKLGNKLIVLSFTPRPEGWTAAHPHLHFLAPMLTKNLTKTSGTCQI